MNHQDPKIRPLHRLTDRDRTVSAFSAPRRWGKLISISKRLQLIVVGSATLLVGATVALISLAAFVEWPGGMRPDYPAVDGDARLTRVARTASPILEALRQYHDQYDDYPDDLTKLETLLPKTSAISGQVVDGWHYFRRPNSAGFGLSIKLGWDTGLQYHSTDADGSWVFAPGDGSPDKPILLNP